MNKYKIIFLTATIVAISILTTSCFDYKKPKKMTDTIQKITPCLWVEKDAKAVADYYLSIFKDGKLKDFRQYKNPPEAGGGDFETATIEIAGMEFSILAAVYG